jgi:hypothetical protein
MRRREGRGVAAVELGGMRPAAKRGATSAGEVELQEGGEGAVGRRRGGRRGESRQRPGLRSRVGGGSLR